MERKFDLLADVVPGRENWNFKVRVVRMWPLYSFMKSDEVNSLELVLIDEKIHASIRRQLLYLFDKKIKEGEVYDLSHVAVAPCFGAYRPTLHPYKLVFQMKTKVFISESPEIPAYGFSFSNIAEICSNEVDYDYLVGKLASYAYNEASRAYGLYEDFQGIRDTLSFVCMRSMDFVNG